MGQLGTAVVGGISPPAFALARGRRPSLDVSIVLSASRRRARGGDSSPARTISPRVLSRVRAHDVVSHRLRLPDLRIAVSSHEDSLAHFWYLMGRRGALLAALTLLCAASPAVARVESKEISLYAEVGTAKDFDVYGFKRADTRSSTSNIDGGELVDSTNSTCTSSGATSWTCTSFGRRCRGPARNTWDWKTPRSPRTAMSLRSAPKSTRRTSSG